MWDTSGTASVTTLLAQPGFANPGDARRLTVLLLGILCLFSVFRSPLHESRRFGPLAVAVGALGCSALVVQGVAFGSGTWWAASTTIVMSAAMAGGILHVFRAPTEPWPKLIAEVGVAWSGLLALLVCVYQPLVSVTKTSSPALHLTVAAALALAAATVVVLAVPESLWNNTARLYALGVILVSAAGLSRFAGTVSWLYAWSSWAALVGLAALAGATLHPDVASVRGQRRTAPSFQTHAPTFAAFGTQLAGVAVLLREPSHPAIIAIGLIAVFAPGTHAALALRRSAQDRAAASAAIQSELMARDHERREVAQLIHNDVLQHIIAAAWMSTDRPAVREQLLLAEGNARLVLEGVRVGAPPVREVSSSIERLVRLLGTTTAWSFSIDDDPALDAVGPVVWSVVREAAVNVVKHAHANRAWVTVERVDNLCQVIVVDDGVGIQTQAIGRQFGLRSMAELVGLAGGSLHCSQRTQGGTEVRAVIPLPA